MKIETKTRDDHQVELTVILDPAQLEGARHRAARKISERKSIPGFRPGKAPYDVVVRTIGLSPITEEAVDILLDEVYPIALAESKVEPGAPGSLEKIDDLDKEPKFVFIVPLAPKVDLGDYRSVRVPYDWKEPGDQDVETEVANYRQMFAKTETVTRSILEGDFVLIDLVGKDVKAEEGTPIAIERNGFPVFIRQEDKTDEWPFTGFAKSLIGAIPEGTVSISHKFPKSHSDESMKGKTIEFSATIKMVRSSTLPEFDNEFAKRFGPFESAQALRDSIKANLVSRSKANYDDEFFAKAIDSIRFGATIHYSSPTLEHEEEHVLEDIKSRLSQQNMDLTAYLKTREMDEEQFKTDEVRPTAIKRLERSLLLDEISRAEKIEVTKDQLDNSFQQTLNELAGTDGFQKYLNGKTRPPKQVVQAMTMESANRAYLQQTLERIKAIATGTASEIPSPDEVETGDKPKPSTKKTAGTKKKPKSTGSESGNKSVPARKKKE